MRTGQQRTSEYRQRLAESGEPPGYVVSNALASVVLGAMRAGEQALTVTEIIERAARAVVGERFSQEGFDNVLTRIAQHPGNRRRRPR